MKKFKFNHSDLGDALSRNQLELILGGGSGVSSKKDLPNCPSLYGGSCTDKTKGLRVGTLFTKEVVEKL